MRSNCLAFTLGFSVAFPEGEKLVGVAVVHFIVRNFMLRSNYFGTNLGLQRSSIDHDFHG